MENSALFRKFVFNQGATTLATITLVNGGSGKIRATPPSKEELSHLGLPVVYFWWRARELPRGQPRTDCTYYNSINVSVTTDYDYANRPGWRRSTRTSVHPPGRRQQNILEFGQWKCSKQVGFREEALCFRKSPRHRRLLRRRPFSNADTWPDIRIDQSWNIPSGRYL